MYPFVTVLLGNHLGHPYTYKNHLEDIQPGDYVVVVLPAGYYGIGKVKDLLTSDLQGKATKYIVDKITFDADKYNALTAMDPPPEPKPQGVQMAPSGALAQYIKAAGLPPPTAVVKFKPGKKGKPKA